MLNKISFTTLLFVFSFSLTVFADEGMWPVNMMKDSVIKIMKQRGLLLNYEDIYNTSGPSLKDAVVVFGSGCTGEIISDEGLVLTNHHCGYGSIQSVSTITSDYISNGFWAADFKDEIPVPSLQVRVLQEMTDITAILLEGITTQMTESQRFAQLQTNFNKAFGAEKKDPFAENVAMAFYSGNSYYKVVYRVYKDIRLVGTPPASIGKFGGDTDNWMWPRHTGDFSIFRIYAGEDNQPAVYSASNKPFKPVKFMSISLDGVKKGDFTFVMGFPGSTEEYLPSYIVDFTRNVDNPNRIAMRDKRLEIIGRFMKTSDTLNLKYTSKHAGIANAWKKWIGENKGLDRLKAIEKKQIFESDFQKWAGNKPEYSGLLNDFKNQVEKNREILLANIYFGECLWAVELIRFAGSFKDIDDWMTWEDKNLQVKLEEFKNKAKSFYKNFDKRIDKEIFRQMISSYMANVPEKYQVDFKDLIKKYKSIDNWADVIYSKSILTDETVFLTQIDNFRKSGYKNLKKDPFYILSERIGEKQDEFEPIVSQYHISTDSLKRLYMKAQMEYQPDRMLFPDANFSMRVTFGKVDSYYPYDGAEYDYRTTADGILEKKALEVYDYVVDEKLESLIRNKDYGKYAQNDTMYVCFTGSNHTTGGNSGSPVIDAKGRLIGINFDRNWEGTMSDIMYDPDMCRNITLDVRYIFFIVDKYAGATRIKDEMMRAVVR